MTAQEIYAAKLSKILTVILLIGIGVVLIAFFSTSSNVTLPEPAKEPAVDDVTSSVDYRRLRWRLDGPNSLVTSDLNRLRAGFPKLTDKVIQTPEEKEQVLVKRAERRAFDGAPPTIPHQLEEQNTTACLTCHSLGVIIEGFVAPVISHTAYASCTQCHVPAVLRDLGMAPEISNTFVGISASKQGDRAWEGAPPSFPHKVWMRQDCASCHGVTGRAGIRTTHPDRPSCQQCHVPMQQEQAWLN